MAGTLTKSAITVNVTVAITGDIDLATRDGIREVLSAALRGGQAHLTADLSGVTFIDACGLGVLLGVRCDAIAAGGSLTLRAPSPAVRRLTGILGLDEVLLAVADLAH